MVAYASAVDTARITVVLLPGSLILRVARMTVSLRRTGNFVARGVVDVFTDFEVEFSL